MNLRHEVIRASAGSGKTFRLSTQYLRLLRLGADPSTILATTFTRKAAGEILERILKRLALAAASDAGAGALGAELGEPSLALADCRRMLRAVCVSLHRLSISTLDSFFNRIARAFCHELGVPPDVALTDDRSPQAVALRLRAIGEMLATDRSAALLDLLRRLSRGTVSRRVTEEISESVEQLYDLFRHSGRDAWDQVEFAASGPGEQALARALAATAAPQPDKRLNKALEKLGATVNDRDWFGLAEHTLIARTLAGDPTYFKKELPSEVVAACEILIAHLRHVILKRISEQTLATHELLAAFDGAFGRLKRSRNLLFFSELPLLITRDLPRRSAETLLEIHYRLDARVQHLLLDEFQDTSAVQWEVIKPIALEITATPAAESGRSFFCVGDMKQAIYGWRGGCAHIFTQMQGELPLDADAITGMDASWRSSPVVLESVNRVFGGLGRSAVLASHSGVVAQWREQFRPHTAVDPARPGHVELRTAAGGADAPEPLAYAAGRIAALAATLPCGEIGVLVRRNNSVRRLFHLLREQGVDASAEGGKEMTDDPAVNAVLAALTLADHPGDSCAGFLLLHSPLGPVLGMKANDAAARHTIAARIRRALVENGYAALITEWAVMLAGVCDAGGATRLEQLVGLADGYDAADRLRPSAFVDFIARTPVETPRTARVRLMTIHKAKGLEFDAVVLPELDLDIGKVALNAALVHRETPTGPIAAVCRNVGESVRRLSPQIAAFHAEEVARELDEDLCGLYVAMTRARHALHMIVPPIEIKADGEISRTGTADLSWATLLRELLRTREVESPAGDEVLYEAGDARWFGGMKAEATAAPRSEDPIQLDLTRARASRRSWRRITPSGLEHGGAVRGRDLLALGSSPAQRRGTILHALLETVGWCDEPGAASPDDALLAAARARCPDATDEERSSCLAEFHAALRDDAVRAALGRPADLAGGETVELWREYQVHASLEEGLINGAMDRVLVVREKGRAVRAEVIDFKTDRIADEAAMAQRVEIYRPQIAAYRRMLQRTLRLKPEAVRGTLLFLGPPARLVTL